LHWALDARTTGWEQEFFELFHVVITVPPMAVTITRSRRNYAAALKISKPFSTAA
jgi:hypothetical protein